MLKPDNRRLKRTLGLSRQRRSTLSQAPNRFPGERHAWDVSVKEAIVYSESAPLLSSDKFTLRPIFPLPTICEVFLIQSLHLNNQVKLLWWQFLLKSSRFRIVSSFIHRGSSAGVQASTLGCEPWLFQDEALLSDVEGCWAEVWNNSWPTRRLPLLSLLLARCALARRLRLIQHELLLL